MLPVSCSAHSIELASGAVLAGVRFHPGVGPCLSAKLSLFDDRSFELQGLHRRLQNCQTQLAQIAGLYHWLNKEVEFSSTVPSSLRTAINRVEETDRLEQVSEHLNLSQRQFERKFKSWVGLTPIHYKRVQRVKKTRQQLKDNPEVKLVDLALANGYSDQSHLTREFKRVAGITPGQYSKRMAFRNQTE